MHRPTILAAIGDIADLIGDAAATILLITERRSGRTPSSDDPTA